MASPAHKIRIGTLQATIWRNSGSNGTWYSVQLTCGYKADDGWREADDLGYPARKRCAKRRQGVSSEATVRGDPNVDCPHLPGQRERPPSAGDRRPFPRSVSRSPRAGREGARRGWEPTGFHTLVEKDEEGRARRTNTKPVPSAKVITAAKDGVKRHFRVETMTECETPEAGFGDILMEPHPTKGFEHRGQWCRIHRYSLCWGWYEPNYAPKSAEQLATAREKREEKAEAKWQAEVEEAAKASLFPEWVREQAAEQRDQKKGRKR